MVFLFMLTDIAYISNEQTHCQDLVAEEVSLVQTINDLF